MRLINFEIDLILTWSKNFVFVLTDITTQAPVPAQGGNPARQAIGAPTNAIFKITGTKLYVRVVTLSTETDNKLLEELKTGFKRTINGMNTDLKWLNRPKLAI